MYTENDWRWYQGGELTHHGILGQRWGVQNGPPYPLSEGAHNASEKKAGWKESLENKIGQVKSQRELISTVRAMTVSRSQPSRRIDSTWDTAEKAFKSSMTKDQKARLKSVADKYKKVKNYDNDVEIKK